MKTIFKYALAATLTGALVLAAVSPGEARGGRRAAAVGVGIVAGALLGAAAANANNGYYYGGGPYYGPGYAYGPGPYAYAPAPVYVQPAPRRYYRSGGCWHVTNSDHNYGYYGACD